MSRTRQRRSRRTSGASFRDPVTGKRRRGVRIRQEWASLTPFTMHDSTPECLLDAWMLDTMRMLGCDVGDPLGDAFEPNGGAIVQTF